MELVIDASTVAAGLAQGQWFCGLRRRKGDLICDEEIVVGIEKVKQDTTKISRDYAAYGEKSGVGNR